MEISILIQLLYYFVLKISICVQAEPLGAHLAKAVLTIAELLALLQLHTFQEFSQHSSVLQL